MRLRRKKRELTPEEQWRLKIRESERAYRPGTEILIREPLAGSGPMELTAPRALWPDPPAGSLKDTQP